MVIPMRSKFHRRLAIGSCSLLLVSMAFQAPAADYHEAAKGDAGATELSGQILPPGTNHIFGSFKAGTGTPFGANPVDVDVFGFGLTKARTVTITASAADLDLNLLLLGEGFLGIWGDDDSGGGPGLGTNPQIKVDLLAGNYYIAVGLDNIAAYASGAVKVDDQVWNNDSGEITDPENKIAIAFVGTMDEAPTPTSGQPYEIELDFSTDAAGVDLSIGKGFGNQIGVNIVNDNAAGQELKALNKRRSLFQMILRNNGNRRNVSMKPAGLRDPDLDIEAFEITAGSRPKKITGAFLSGRYQISMIELEQVRYSVVIMPKPKVAFRVRGSASVSARDTSNGRFRDRVRVEYDVR